MTRHLLAIIGQPGAGKTTAVRHALGSPSVELLSEIILEPFAHVVVPQAHAAMLGLPRDPFGGTDALPMNVQPRVIEWLAATDVEYVLAEGDRLANGKFFRAVLDLGWSLTICIINTPNALAAERRAQRGTRQNPIWVKGRISKIERLAEEWAPLVWQLDGAASPEHLAAQLREHPVLCALRGELLIDRMPDHGTAQESVARASTPPAGIAP